MLTPLDINETELSTTEAAGVKFRDENPIFILPITLSVLACLSQVVMILIARGLKGNFSAKTFLWTQAIGQILQQLVIFNFASCRAIGEFFFLNFISNLNLNYDYFS